MDLGKSIGKLFSARILSAVLQFFAIAVFTKVLGAGAMGSYFLFQTVIGLVGIPGDLGVAKATEKALSSTDEHGEIITSSVLLKILLLLPWTVAIVVFAPHIDRYIGISNISPLVVFGLYSLQFRRLLIRMLGGQMKIGKTAVYRVLENAVWIFSGYLIVTMGGGNISIIIGQLLGHLVIIFGLLLRLDLTYDRPSFASMKYLTNFGRYVFIGSVSGYAYSWMDVGILRFFVPPSTIAAYEIAWRVASMSMMLTQAVRESIFPKVADWYANDELNEISDAFYTWVQPALFISIPALGGAIVFGNDILVLLFRPEVAIGYSVLIIFMLEKISRNVHMILSPSLFAMDKPELGYRGSLAAIVVNLLLNISLIPFFGMNGAAIATTISATVSAIINAYYVSQFVTIRLPLKRIGWCSIATVAMTGVLVIINPVIPNGIEGLFIGISTGVILYFSILLLDTNIRDEMSGLLRSHTIRSE